MADAEFEQGEPSGEQLPKGAAGSVNAGTNVEAPEALVEPSIEGGGEEDVIEPALPEDYEPDFQAESDDDVFITGPTLRPDEDVAVGAFMPSGLDDGTSRHLTLLQEAASEEGASAELRALVGLLIRRSQR